MTAAGGSPPSFSTIKPQVRSGGSADCAGVADAERALVIVADATEAALGAVRDAKRRADVLRIRRDAIQDQQSTGYRRRSAHLPHLGEQVRSVAAEMEALRPLRPS
jgi:hypothetical protein